MKRKHTVKEEYEKFTINRVAEDGTPLQFDAVVTISQSKPVPHERRKSFAKWALPGQNNGTGTVNQLRQSITDHRRHLESLKRGFPMQTNSKINFLPWTHGSRSNFRRSKYAPVVGSQMKVIHSGGTRIGHFPK